MVAIREIEEELQRYGRRNPTERGIVRRFGALLREGHRAFSRQREAGHLTASGWVVDAERSRVLLVHHRKLDKWLQPGGHADGESDLLRVAQKEVMEETGVRTVAPRGRLFYDLDIHAIPARGEVSEHEHFDVRYLLIAREESEPKGNDETHDARWVPLEKLEELTTEDSILRMREKLRETEG